MTRARGLLLLLPAALLALMLVFALAFLVAESLGSAETGPPTLAWSLSTWESTIGGDYFWRVLLRSSLLGAVVASLGIVVGYPTAVALQVLSGQRTRLLLFALIFSPLLISAVARVYAWSLILGPTGALRGLLAPIANSPGDPFASFPGVTIVLVQNVVPLAVFPILASLTRVQAQLGEAAQLLGATPWQRFTRVTLPLTAPTVIAVFEVLFIVSISTFAVPTLVGQGHVQVLASDVYQEVIAFNWSQASVEVIVLLAISVATIALGGVLARWMTRGLPSQGEAS